jgi:two-component system, NtrC family, response regulator HydG
MRRFADCSLSTSQLDSKNSAGVAMTQDVHRNEVTFLDFPSSNSAVRSGSATIAVFPRPASRGRTRAQDEASDDGTQLIGKSPGIVELCAQLRRIARSQATVMLVGESGTGKEVAAELLHSQSVRSNAPFLAVNCGAIPANLVEAELFGYEKGAFTGASRQHRGYFERAAGGTLFLDEITEMPLELQTKLLRVLESGRMVRVGGAEEIGVDVRVLTATNHAPEMIIRDRRLREDLYYRLAVFVVRLPPLRERTEDIPLLAQVFLDRLNREYHTHKVFDPGSLALARAHAWPGNVRELKNCIERSFVLCDDVVTLDVHPVRQPAADIDDPRENIRVPIGMTMAEVERRVLVATLRHCGGNKRRTAEMLGVSVKTVYNKLVGWNDDSRTPSPSHHGHADGSSPIDTPARIGAPCRHTLHPA